MRSKINKKGLGRGRMTWVDELVEGKEGERKARMIKQGS